MPHTTDWPPNISRNENTKTAALKFCIMEYRNRRGIFLFNLHGDLHGTGYVPLLNEPISPQLGSLDMLSFNERLSHQLMSLGMCHPSMNLSETNLGHWISATGYLALQWTSFTPAYVTSTRNYTNSSKAWNLCNAYLNFQPKLRTSDSAKVSQSLRESVTMIWFEMTSIKPAAKLLQNDHWNSPQVPFSSSGHLMSLLSKLRVVACTKQSELCAGGWCNTNLTPAAPLALLLGVLHIILQCGLLNLSPQWRSW